MNEGENQKKKHLKIFLPFFVIAFIFSIMIAGLFSGTGNVLPAEEEEVTKYQAIGNQLNVNWEWIMLIDMYQAEFAKTDFSQQNPVHTALNCLKITIDVYSEEEDDDGDEHWEYDYSDYANGAEEILSYFGLPADTNDVNLVVRTIERMDSDKYRIKMEPYPELEEVLNTYYHFPEDMLSEILELNEVHYFAEAYGQDLFNGSDGIFEGEISGQVPAIGMKIPLYYQYQEPWRNVKFGDGTISTSGCSITCISMVFNYVNSLSLSPDQVAAWAGTKYHVRGSGASWDIFPAAAKRWGVHCTGLGKNMNNVIAALSEGKPVIASMDKGTFTKGGHFIVLRGITEDGKILVNDPNDNAKKQHFNKSFDVGLIKREAKQFWSFE